jgi:hypothetical protein
MKAREALKKQGEDDDEPKEYHCKDCRERDLLRHVQLRHLFLWMPQG